MYQIIILVSEGHAQKKKHKKTITFNIVTATQRKLKMYQIIILFSEKYAFKNKTEETTTLDTTTS